MQSTGHSSIQALSLRSTQGSAIVYVTKGSSRSPAGCLAEPVGAEADWFRQLPGGAMSWLLILDVAYTTQTPGHYARHCSATSCIGGSSVLMLRRWHSPTRSWWR